MTGKPLRVLVCGGRYYDDAKFLHKILSEWPTEIACIIEGGATGADYLARMFGQSKGIPVESYPVTKAEWDTYGRAAGPMRNARMLKEGRPDIVIAFPGERGTRDMMKQARLARVLTYDMSKPIEGQN